MRITKSRLLDILRDAPDGAVLVVPGHDHSYQEAGVEVTTGLRGRHGWSEGHGEDLTPEAEYGKRLPVILVR